MLQADCSEAAGLDRGKTTLSNDRSVDVGCNAATSVPHMRADAAPATCPNINVGKVRIPDVGVNCGERLHPSHTYVKTTIEGSATLRDGAQLNLWAPKAKPIFHFL